MKILVTGSNGQLGSEIKDLTHNYNELIFYFTDLQKLNICDSLELQNFIVKNNINAVINCAAYTAVDMAEKNEEKAQKVNADGVLNLINALRKVNGKLIHISTDYVFDGNSFIPYKESDEVNPIGVYAKTKRSGELNVINSDIEAIVIRTSWLYSVYGENFLKNILKLGKERDELGVIFDQIGTPTSASDLAKTCLDILSNNIDHLSKNGKVYHFSNEGVASWYDFAIAILELNRINCVINPITTNEFPTLAKRPHFSVLNKTKIKQDFQIKIQNWREALKICILKLNTKK